MSLRAKKPEKPAAKEAQHTAAHRRNRGGKATSRTTKEFRHAIHRFVAQAKKIPAAVGSDRRDSFVLRLLLASVCLFLRRGGPGGRSRTGSGHFSFGHESSGRNIAQQAGARAMGKEDRGFASMDPERQRRASSKGGKSTQNKKTGRRWTSEEARKAALKGSEIRRRRMLERQQQQQEPSKEDEQEENDE